MNKKVLIGCQSPKSGGKDTFHEILNSMYGGWEDEEILMSFQDGVSPMTEVPYIENIKFANKLKLIVAILTGDKDQWSQEGKSRMIESWGMTNGKIQQLLGTEGIRSLNENAWVHALFSDYPPDSELNLFISDMRFPNEYDAVRERGGITVKIIRAQRDDADDGRDPTHASETALNHIDDWDEIIENTSWEEFIAQIRSFYNKYCV